MSDPLASWTRDTFSAEGIVRDVFRRGSGPGVVVIHEMPGITPEVARFADEVVASGFTVALPSLLGVPGAEMSVGTLARAFGSLCVSKEFARLAEGSSAPLSRWLQALARDLHGRVGGPGVGTIGMCFTGGFALAMMVGAPVVAPVLSQPANPLPIGRRRAASLGLSDADLTAVKATVAAGCPVLGLRYTGDPLVGTRFETLRRELGEGFLAVEFPGSGHSVLTLQRQQVGVDRVLAFLHDQLDAPASESDPTR